ncbi:hypothetical protein EDD18DRAFT_1108470 [Armillaria luteobubalina]|uniref:Uncharacterized protein n=1 Tax=Armillaria luteobubalina TaxID=153913 RepID=A0AA39Q064_9AGAR|nr:hypothetical protein EDD18DRAFT_1108470 [Armillaria luteobubalina]
MARKAFKDIAFGTIAGIITAVPDVDACVGKHWEIWMNDTKCLVFKLRKPRETALAALYASNVAVIVPQSMSPVNESSNPFSKMNTPPLISKSPSMDQVPYSPDLDGPNPDFHIEPNAHCNGGLKNAVDLVSFSSVQPQMWKVWVSTLGAETDTWSGMLHEHTSMHLWAGGYKSKVIWVENMMWKSSCVEMLNYSARLRLYGDSGWVILWRNPLITSGLEDKLPKLRTISSTGERYGLQIIPSVNRELKTIWSNFFICSLRLQVFTATKI